MKILNRVSLGKITAVLSLFIFAFMTFGMPQSASAASKYEFMYVNGTSKSRVDADHGGAVFVIGWFENSDDSTPTYIYRYYNDTSFRFVNPEGYQGASNYIDFSWNDIDETNGNATDVSSQGSDGIFIANGGEFRRVFPSEDSEPQKDVTPPAVPDSNYQFMYVEDGTKTKVDKDAPNAVFALGWFENNGDANPKYVYYHDSGSTYTFTNPEGFQGSANYITFTYDSMKDTYSPNGIEHTGSDELYINISNGSEFLSVFPSEGAEPTEETDSKAAAQNQGNTCEDKSGAWGWMLCGVVNLIGGTLDFFDGIIAGFLDVDESQFENNELQAGWEIMRNIAYFVLLPIGLVMIVGTALGFEVFSAYTIKKAFPRLVFAIIFITFSYQITTFGVSVINSVGRGVDGLVTSPIRRSDKFNERSSCTDEIKLPCFFESETTGVVGIFDGIISGVVGPIAFVAGLVLFLVFFGSTFALAFLIGALVLLAREIAIIACVLLAPVAILSWIFPGNDGLWKAWWNMYSKLLLMYPLIIVLISSGKLFAWIVSL